MHQHVHARHGLEPAGVLAEVQGDETQTLVEVRRRNKMWAHRVPDFVATRLRPQRAHHAIARVQQLKNNVLGDETA